jgi:hypothetical protein
MHLAYECGAGRKAEAGATFQLAGLGARENVRLHEEKTGRTISAFRVIHILLHRLRVDAAAGDHDGAA